MQPVHCIAGALFTLFAASVLSAEETAVGTMLSIDRFGRQSCASGSGDSSPYSNFSLGLNAALPGNTTLTIDGSYDLNRSVTNAGPLQFFFTGAWNRGLFTAGIGVSDGHEASASTFHERHCSGPAGTPYTCIDTVNDDITTITSIHRPALHSGMAASLRCSSTRSLFAGIDGSYSRVDGMKCTASSAESTLTVDNYADQAWAATVTAAAGMVNDFTFLRNHWASTVQLRWHHSASTSVPLANAATDAWAAQPQRNISLLQYRGTTAASDYLSCMYQWEEYDVHLKFREKLAHRKLLSCFFIPDTFSVFAQYGRSSSRSTIVNRWTDDDGSREYGITRRQAGFHYGVAFAGFGTTLHFLRYAYLRGMCRTYCITDFSQVQYTVYTGIESGIAFFVKNRLLIGLRCTPLRVQQANGFDLYTGTNGSIISLQAVLLDR